jgi:hypothetical protein
MGRLVKSGSLGSARGTQPTVEAGVAHSEYPHLTSLLFSLSFPNNFSAREERTRATVRLAPR